MSPDGQAGAGGWSSGGAVTVGTFPMSAGVRFAWHSHEEHQLAWASSGVLTVITEAATWVLPPTRALWIPAGLPHEARASGVTTMRSLYAQPSRFPVAWARPTAVAATQLLAEMIGYLSDGDLDIERRRRAEAVLVDLLEPVAVTTIEVRMPTDDRARDVAGALVADPACKRTLGDWGEEVGASERTLARLWLAEVGVPFGRWRTLVRLQSALPALADGEPVSRVAMKAGYDSASAFVAAFRRETGLTPAAYFEPPASPS